MYDAVDRMLEAGNDLHNRLGEVLVNDWFRHLPRMFLFFAIIIVVLWGIDAIALWKDRKGLIIVTAILMLGIAVATFTS